MHNNFKVIHGGGSSGTVWRVDEDVPSFFLEDALNRVSKEGWKVFTILRADGVAEARVPEGNVIKRKLGHYVNVVLFREL